MVRLVAEKEDTRMETSWRLVVGLAVLCGPYVLMRIIEKWRERKKKEKGQS